ncbi:glycosyltransferase family 39 protein [Nocardia sp. NPDC005978]|uniref:ArnT family glycosyltransferase n=1 Tax=Nocardia sp. NPDC005978 TaxID=3156725 RepID=UPI0033BD1E95
MCLTQGGYDVTGDEYFYLVAGSYPSWGYADQPWLVATLAHAADIIDPGNLALLRFPMVIAVAVGIYMCALLSREFGGGPRVQLLAACAFAISPYALSHSRALTTDAVDMAMWSTVIWLLVRWVKEDSDRLWIAIAGATVLALQGKYLIPTFWGLTVIAIAVAGPRRFFTRPIVYAAGAISIVSMIPSLLWQARNGWPQLIEGPAIWSDISEFGGRLIFVPSVIGSLGLVGTVLFGAGLWFLLRKASGYRFLGVVVVLLLALVWVAMLRRNYLGGVFPLALAAGAVGLGEIGWCQGRIWRVQWAAIIASIVVLMPAFVPVGPQWMGGATRYLIPSHRHDWNLLAEAVGRTVNEVPDTERERTIVIAGDYWRSSVLERLGPAYSLPPVYGTMQGAWYLRRPPDGTRTIVYVDTPPPILIANCGSLRHARTVIDDNISPLANEQRETRISICSGLNIPIDTLWDNMKNTTLPN